MPRRKTNQIHETETAGPLLLDFIDKQLSAEMERRRFLDARGIGIVTTSGTLVTIIFALGALATDVEDYRPNSVSLVSLALAMVAFVTAATLGLLASRLRWYDVVQPAQMHRWRQSERKWNDDASKARRLLAKANIDTLDTLRKGNDEKASLIDAALWAQLVAIGALSVTVGSAVVTL